MNIELYIAGAAIGLLSFAVLTLWRKVRKLEQANEIHTIWRQSLREDLGSAQAETSARFDRMQDRLQTQIDATREMLCEGFKALGLERVPPGPGKWVKRP